MRLLLRLWLRARLFAPPLAAWPERLARVSTTEPTRIIGWADACTSSENRCHQQHSTLDTPNDTVSSTLVKVAQLGQNIGLLASTSWWLASYPLWVNSATCWALCVRTWARLEQYRRLTTVLLVFIKN